MKGELNLGLKGKIAKLAGERVAEKLLTSQTVNDVLNNAINISERSSGKKSTEEYIKAIKNNYLVIKERSRSVGTMINILSDKKEHIDDPLGRYRVYDNLGNLKYKSTVEITLADREVIDIFDENDRKIGCVKEHLLSAGVPLLEKEVKKCSVYLGKDKICELKKYKSFGDLYFEVLDGNVKIEHDKGQNFKINYKGKILSKLHDVPYKMKDGYTDKFVMEYCDVKNDIVGVLLAIALDVIND